MRNLSQVTAALLGGLFWVVGATSVSAQDKTYQKPTYSDLRLDWCWTLSDKDCGKTVADTFCRGRRFTGAKDFRGEKAGGATRFIGSRETCKGASCFGFASITCFGPIQQCTQGTTDVCNYPNPAWKGKRLDWCREWGTNCGRPAANAFCQKMGFARSVYERSDNKPGGGPTRMIGTDQICDKSFCLAFNTINCSRT
jgi:hypothetical protein